MNSKQFLVLAASLSGAAAVAADFDGSEPLMCSFGEAIECDDGAECREVSLESIDAPDFVKLDFRKKQIVSVLAGEDGAANRRRSSSSAPALRNTIEKESRPSDGPGICDLVAGRASYNRSVPAAYRCTEHTAGELPDQFFFGGLRSYYCMKSPTMPASTSLSPTYPACAGQIYVTSFNFGS